MKLGKPSVNRVIRGVAAYTEFSQKCARCQYNLVMAPSLEWLMCIRCLDQPLQPIQSDPTKKGE